MSSQTAEGHSYAPGGRNSQLAHNTTLSIDMDTTRAIRMNRIICTIGPKTQTVPALKELIKAGMSVARMNFSHGSYEFHQATIDNVRIAAKELNTYVAIALDTKGPEIRTGLFIGGVAHIATGDIITVTTDPSWEAKGTKEQFYLDYANLASVVSVGGKIFIDDGVLELTITEIVDAKTIKVQACNDHDLTNRKGTNLPKAKIDLPAVSEKDKQDLLFGAKNHVDMVFASFIRDAQQVEEVRASLGPERGPKTQIIAKIENHQGVEAIDSILHVADGVMVARGDLGVEIPAEQVVIAQKMLIAKCNVVGKPVICATQMLESMTQNPRPTRAEVSDVANAVLDGADAVMLSGETAKGLYPTQVVRYMSRICIQAQLATREAVNFWNVKALQHTPLSPDESICSSAVNSAFELDAKVMIVLSNTGKSAKLLAKYRPHCPIICSTQEESITRSLALVRGVFCVYYDTALYGEDHEHQKRVYIAMQYAVNSFPHLVKPGSIIVAVHADQFTKGHANQTRILSIPENVQTILHPVESSLEVPRPLARGAGCATPTPGSPVSMGVVEATSDRMPATLPTPTGTPVTANGPTGSNGAAASFPIVTSKPTTDGSAPTKFEDVHSLPPRADGTQKPKDPSSPLATAVPSVTAKK